MMKVTAPVLNLDRLNDRTADANLQILLDSLKLLHVVDLQLQARRLPPQHRRVSAAHTVAQSALLIGYFHTQNPPACFPSDSRQLR